MQIAPILTAEDYARILRFARRFTRSADDAHDLAHEAIAAYLDGRRGWDRDRLPFVVFIYGVMRSLASTRTKQERRRPVRQEFEGEEFAAADPTPEDALVGIEQHEVVTDALRAHVGDDEDLRALWAAIEDDSVKRADIAEVLGWAPARVTAARLKLQRRLTSLLR